MHPCGDLAAILTDFFLKSKEAAFLNLVGCCYFKMSVPPTDALICSDNQISSYGYPLSEYLLKTSPLPNICHLSFESREIACHAIEVYAARLAVKNYEYLRVHSFRAAIEKIICKNWPDRKRSGLRSIKHLTTFRDYCRQAVNHLEEINIPEGDIDATETLNDLSRWKFVVIFYTLRLMFAPLVESVILYDRLLWLMENGNYFLRVSATYNYRKQKCKLKTFFIIIAGCVAKISAIFDPVVSPRNHIITALKS